MTQLIRITHLLFVYDVIIFSEGTKEDWISYNFILDILCNSTGMKITDTKSTFLKYEVEEQFIREFKYVFPYEIHKIDRGLKYLGCFLKPNNYLK